VTNLIVAKRYAKALLEIGREDGQFEQYGQELKQFVSLFDQAPDLEKVLANPAFAFENRAQVLANVLAKLGLSPMANNFLRLLMDRGRMRDVRAINIVYAQLVDEAKGIRRAEITAAASLKQAEVDGLTAALKKLAGREVLVEVKEDPSLIGGVVARIGDLVLDGSVKTQLESLKDSLRRGEYA